MELIIRLCEIMSSYALMVKVYMMVSVVIVLVAARCQHEF